MKLRYARREKYLLQEELARTAKLTKQQIHSFETGDAKIPEETLFQLAMILDKPGSWFYENIESPLYETKQADDDYEECRRLLGELKGEDTLKTIKDILRLAVSGRA